MLLGRGLLCNFLLGLWGELSAAKEDDLFPKERRKQKAGPGAFQDRVSIECGYLSHKSGPFPLNPIQFVARWHQE